MNELFNHARFIFSFIVNATLFIINFSKLLKLKRQSPKTNVFQFVLIHLLLFDNK